MMPLINRKVPLIDRIVFARHLRPPMFGSILSRPSLAISHVMAPPCPAVQQEHGHRFFIAWHPGIGLLIVVLGW